MGEDLLSALIQAKDEDGAPMSDRQLRDELVTLIFTGSETRFEDLLSQPTEFCAVFKPRLQGHPGSVSLCGGRGSPRQKKPRIAATLILRALSAQLLKWMTMIPARHEPGISGAFRTEGKSEPPRNTLNESPPLIILLEGLAMFQHQWSACG